MKRRFEYCDEKSNKFWEIEVIDKALTVTYGKIGTDGQSVTKKFKSADAALTEAEKQISEKTKKGYVEVISAPAGSKLRLTLETGAYFSNTSVYRKNKRSYFTVERRRTACSAIATEIRKPNSCTPVVISDVLFEGSSHKDAFFLTLSKGIDEKDKRRINKAFKADPDYLTLDGYERQWSESKDAVQGGFNVLPVPYNVLTLSCSQIQVSVVEITRDQFIEFKASGLPRSFDDKFIDEIELEGAHFEDVSFSVNYVDSKSGLSRISRLYKKSKSEDSVQSLKSDLRSTTVEKNKLFAIFLATLSDATYNLTIYEDFDPEKLGLEVESFPVKGFKSAFIGFQLSYGSQEFEFQGDGGGPVEYYLVDSGGKLKKVSMADNEDAGETKEDYNSDDD